MNKGRTGGTEGEQIVIAMRSAHGCYAKKHGTDREPCHNFATILAYHIGVGQRSVDMTFDELKIALVKLERRWDEGLIDDQMFDHLAAKAAMEWARHTRDYILGRVQS